jgi:ParB-like nuclease domain
MLEQLADNGENSGKYEVVAGGRRFAALQRLAKQKKVPKTFAVPCLVVDPAAATETSLAENIIRVAMHPADQFIAFHDLIIQSGLSIAIRNDCALKVCMPETCPTDKRLFLKRCSRRIQNPGARIQKLKT